MDAPYLVDTLQRLGIDKENSKKVEGLMDLTRGLLDSEENISSRTGRLKEAKIRDLQQAIKTQWELEES